MLLPQLLKQEGLVTVMVMMLMMVPDYSEGQTTCTAITTVCNTSVTCLFAEDISQLSFNVQFFFPNTSVDPETILACNIQMSGGLACYKGRQILFDEKQKIVDRFTLSRPPSLNKLKGGHYRCFAVQPLIKRSEFCPLTYRDVPRLVPLPTPHNENTRKDQTPMNLELEVKAKKEIHALRKAQKMKAKERDKKEKTGKQEADKKAIEEKQEADKKAIEEKQEADKKARADKREADKKARADK